MKSVWITTVVFALLAVSWVPAQSQPIPDQYIVVLHDDVDPDQAVRGMGVAPMNVFRHALKGFALRIPAQAAAALERNPMVKYVELDQVVTLNAPGKDIIVIQGKAPKPAPTPTPPTVQTVPPGMYQIGVSTSYVDSRIGSIGVAVIDTGVDLDHPDLNVGAGFTSPVIVTRLAAGDDDHGHGTHVAGIIAAKNNGLGVLGAAPGARIHPVKVFDRRGGGSVGTMIQGIEWVMAHKDEYQIRVANLSGGTYYGGYPAVSLDEAVQNTVAAGVVFVTSAGNNSGDIAVLGNSPAREPKAVTVSSVGPTNSFSSFSNWGSAVDMAAPGENVLSTYKGGAYAYMTGTSMSAPHVSGAVALYLAIDGRDYNGDSVGNELDVIKAGVVPSTPRPQDPDGTPEPLVNVESFYWTSTPTPTPTDTHTPTPTDTHTPTPTDTETPLPVPTDTETPIPTEAPTPVQ